MKTLAKLLSAIGIWSVTLAVQSAASQYQVSLEDSAWEVSSSIFSCTMTHDIPYYGKGLFEHRAGETSNFQLLPSVPRLESGKASLVSRAPHWKKPGADLDLGYVSVQRGKKPVRLNSRLSEQVLAELHSGREVVFTRAPWYGAESSSKVTLSNVNFPAAYRQYLACLADLLPVNFDQIRKTAIYFAPGADEPQAKELQKLDNIAIYVKADTSVQSFFIDGHTDAQGNREENLELSQRRAEWVMDMLVSRGVPAAKITTRWHGERYPVASNRTADGRNANRRVTIRLEKEGAADAPSVQASRPPGKENT